MAVISFKRSLYSSNPDKYISFLAGNSAYNPSSFESIATITATGAETSLTLSSIPSTYKSLQIRAICRDNAGGSSGPNFVQIRFNGDSGTNYAYHQLKGDGASATATGAASTTSYLTNYFSTSSSAAANIFGAAIIDITDYASTTKNKTARGLYGTDSNNTVGGEVGLSSGLWINTAAITSITFVKSVGFAAGSTFALYGIKGA